MNIFLIGYRCTGKTTVGHILAERITFRFVDTDGLIVVELGTTVSNVVDRWGWEYFRREETNIIARVCADDEQVVSTGGGVILNPENTKAMKQTGTVVWLKSKPKTILARMRADDKTRGQRPALSQGSPIDEVADVLSERTPLYNQAADMEVATDVLSPNQVTDAIIQSLKL